MTDGPTGQRTELAARRDRTRDGPRTAPDGPRPAVPAPASPGLRLQPPRPQPSRRPAAGHPSRRSPGSARRARRSARCRRRPLRRSRRVRACRERLAVAAGRRPATSTRPTRPRRRRSGRVVRRQSSARRPARRARLRLTRVDPWSVMKTAFLLSIAFGVVTVVSVLMVWSVLGAAGVWDSINATVQNVLGEESADARSTSRTTSAPPASSASPCWSRSSTSCC